MRVFALLSHPPLVINILDRYERGEKIETKPILGYYVYRLSTCHHGCVLVLFKPCDWLTWFMRVSLLVLLLVRTGLLSKPLLRPRMSISRVQVYTACGKYLDGNAVFLVNLANNIWKCDQSGHLSQAQYIWHKFSICSCPKHHNFSVSFCHRLKLSKHSSAPTI